MNLSLDFENTGSRTLHSCIEKAMDDDSHIENMTFENEDLTEYDISCMEFEKVRFVKCDFKKCTFSRSRFYDAEFINCNISLSDFSKTFWKKVTIHESSAVGIKCVEGIIKEAKITKSILDYANFSNASLENCLFDDCKFTESYFAETKIKKLQLKKILFTGTDFFKTSLKGLDLSDCLIDGIKISADFFELRGAKINAQQAVDLITLFNIEVV
ncbi:MAG: pentapeptide repeat-containing protein [Spirochaetaceae bacterium]|nr:pentapeptide repeat-containing protein [Spirochaetaceae bacterium]